MLNFQLSIPHNRRGCHIQLKPILAVGYPVVLLSKISLQLFGLLICCSISHQILSDLWWRSLIRVGVMCEITAEERSELPTTI